MHRTLDVVITPIGRYRLIASERGLTGIAPERAGEAPACHERGSAAAKRHIARARLALAAYFAGTRRDFDDLALDLSAGTPFQQRVWRALREVPYATTLGYGELALRLGNPQAPRAVGAANRRNPLAIVVPCHRIVAADGSLTGYAHGLERKRWLLDHEAGCRERTADQATSNSSSSDSPRAPSRRRASAPTSI